MSVNGKVQPKRSRIKGNLPTYQFSIVDNRRHPKTNTPTPTTLKYVGTLKPNDYQNARGCADFLKALKQIVFEMIWEEQITVADGKKIMERFRSYPIDGITLVERTEVKIRSKV